LGAESPSPTLGIWAARAGRGGHQQLRYKEPGENSPTIPDAKMAGTARSGGKKKLAEDFIQA